jgi:2-dehydropantoate 2-reductase
MIGGKMRILVVGAGAVGGYFGGRLSLIGRDVTFLVREQRAAEIRDRGFEILSPHGDATVRPLVVTAGEIKGAYDLVLLSVKGYELANAIEDFAAAVGEHTAIQPVLNGMRHIDVLTDRFGASRVLGGVCIVATVIDEQRRIVQLNDMQSMTYGELDGSSSARLETIDHDCQGAGFAANASSSIVQEMWEKWVFIAALGGITCLLRGSVGDIEAAPRGRNLTTAMLDECIIRSRSIQDTVLVRTRWRVPRIC